MQAKLVGKTGALAGREFLISKELTIGKGTENTVALRHRFVSRRHARIYFDARKKCYFVEDFKSQNGTKLDGERIRKRERLANIHIISIGRRFEFFFVAVKEGFESKKTSSNVKVQAVETKKKTGHVEEGKVIKDSAGVTVVDEPVNPTNESETVTCNSLVEMADSVLQDGAQHKQDDSVAPPVQNGRERRSERVPMASFSPSSVPATKTVFQAPPAPEKTKEKRPRLVLRVKGINKKFALSEGLNVIGRTGACDVVINDESVSRQHACISVQKDTIQLNDLDSKNRTFIGKREVQAVTDIPPDTAIKFGDVEAILTLA